jgi:hypothetical protein
MGNLLNLQKIMENKKISVEFLLEKGFQKRKACNACYFEKNKVAITFDYGLWILCVVIDNRVYYMAPILYLKTEDELIKYYQECTKEKI